MSKINQKMAVFSVLKAQKTAIGLSELMLLLGDQFAERSVRRWLAELVIDGNVEKLGKKRGTRYQILKSLSNFAFDEISQALLMDVQKPLFERNPVSYNDDWFNRYQPNQTYYLSTAQRHLLEVAGQPEDQVAPAGTYAHRIYHRLLIDLAYNSSRLEGNTYSLGETEKLIMEGVDGAGKLDAEKVMILNHKEAIRYLVDHAEKLVIDVNTICTVHYLLSDGLVLSQQAGKFRDHAVRISSSTYMPKEDAKRLQSQLARICSVASKIQNPFEQSFFLLVHISYLQAFTDVNKRTARLIANIPFIKKNLYPIAFNQINKEDYISAMIAVYELNNPHALSELYTASYLYTSREYKALVSAMGLDEVRVRFRKILRETIRAIINENKHGADANDYTAMQAKKHIPAAFQSEFKRIVSEELKNMGPERIMGLGVTQQALLVWQKK